MEIITVFGILVQARIIVDNVIYRLNTDSRVLNPLTGWFQLLKYGEKYKLLRVVELDRAKVLKSEVCKEVEE